jgi:hypothetical protein
MSKWKLRIFWLCEILYFVDKIKIEVAPVFKKAAQELRMEGRL